MRQKKNLIRANLFASGKPAVLCQFHDVMKFLMGGNRLLKLVTQLKFFI